MLRTIIIFAVFCAISFAFYKYSTNKAKKIKETFNEDEVKNDIKTYVSNILNSELEFLNTWMQNHPIDYFTDASIPVSLKDKAKSAATDAVKKVAWAAVGVKAKYQTVEPPTYLVLSGDELHYLAANIDGDLKTHLTFTKDQLINAKIEYKGPKKGPSLASGVSDFMSNKLNNEDAVVNVFAITLNLNGEPITIQAHDKMVLPIEMASSDYTKNTLIANTIANTFFNKLAEKYPNLKASKTRMVSLNNEI